MSLKVKPVASAAQKFVSRASAATGDYKDGVNSTNDQAERAIAAAPAYEQGVIDAISRGAREKGLERVGTSKWKERALSLGSGRYSSGVKAGEGDYQKNVAPYFQTLANLTLTPRGPKGSPENYGRAQEVGEALHQQKIATQSS